MAATARTATRNSGDRRFAERGELGRPGTVRMDDSAPLAVLVRDLTRDGCRIASDAELPPGVGVHIGLAHVGLTAGRIVWRSETDYGCRFDVPLAPGMVTAALGPSNIAAFPEIFDVKLQGSAKLGPRTNLAITCVLAAATWAMAIAIGRMLLA